MEKNTTIQKIIELIKGTGAIVLFVILPEIISPFFYHGVKYGGFWTKNITYLLYEITLVGIFCFLYRKTLQKDWKDFKENRTAYLKKGVPLWVTGLILMVISNLLINLVFTNGNIAANEEANRAIITKLPLYSVSSMIFFGPIMEEIIFRRGFYYAIENKIAYALFTALIFAGFHVATGIESFQAITQHWTELLYLIPYGALGFVFALAYKKTDNIFTSMSLHMLHNTLSVGMILLSFLLQRFA